jgi:hypothetical protein
MEIKALKKVFPVDLKLIYRKFKWFWSNFSEIEFDSILRSTHYYGPITYDTDGLTTCNNADFMVEPRFDKAYQAAKIADGREDFTLQWRIYVVCWFANYVKKLAGDFVECGVNRGALSRAIIEYLDFDSLGKTFFLFDTFDGLPEELVTEEERQCGINAYMNGYYKDVYQHVSLTFAPFNVNIIKGKVPDSLTAFNGKSVCYLSIDMNVVAPEIAAAEFFWDKIVEGGVVVLDDYGFPMHIHQKKAFDAFAKKYNQQILCLPTGQGIIIKQ